jgi:hypothetical protein
MALDSVCPGYLSVMVGRKGLRDILCAHYTQVSIFSQSELHCVDFSASSGPNARGAGEQGRRELFQSRSHKRINCLNLLRYFR